MREGAIADRGARDRREPAVEHRELQRERRQHWQLILREVIHDLLRVRDILLLVEIALHEALHVGDAVRIGASAEDLQVDGRKVMIGIGLQLGLKLRERLRLYRISIRIWIAQVRRDSVDLRIHRLQRPQHVIKRSVLHHQHDDVLQLVESRRH